MSLTDDATVLQYMCAFREPSGKSVREQRPQSVNERETSSPACFGLVLRELACPTVFCV